ncbi:MAG: hypothetical protein LCH56_15475 [Proteobacteria bacterium]|nr:hypothetical protein [Pseudomonadota bacterium]
MKIAVCVPPPVADAYGHLTCYAEKIAEIGAARGMETEVLRYADDDFFARLFANLMDEDCLVHFHSFLYDLKVHTSPAVKKVRHALEFARARTIATVSDHPFSDFMQEMVRNAHPKTKFIVIDNTFPDEMRFINPALEEAEFVHQPFVAPVSFEDQRYIEFDRRDYDLVLPLLLIDTSKLNLKTLLGGIGDGWFSRSVMATYEIVRSDLSQNPFHVFTHVMKAETGAEPADLQSKHPKVIPALLRSLSIVDGYVRHERRTRVVKSLLRDIGDLKVAVLGNPAKGLEIDPKVEFVGIQRAAGTAAIIANSRAILNCSPSYPRNVHERVTVGMLYDACVITDTNPCIAENFSEDDYVPYGPGGTMTIADIFATHDMHAIAKRSGDKARAHPEFSWHGHFDSVLQIAQA